MSSDAVPKKPVLTKAERRAQQEAQRAAKGQKPSGGAASPKAAASTKASSPAASTSRSAATAPTGTIASARAAASTSQAPSLPVAAPRPQGAQSAEIFKRFFSHLDTSDSRPAKHKAEPVHPAVARLCLLLSEFKIVGANARCIALIDTFKEVIRTYQVPPGASLSRHLVQHVNAQIGHVKQARGTLGVSTGNAVRFLKAEIVQTPPELDDDEARTLLCEKLDHFVRDRIILAGEVIRSHATSKIRSGDTILTFARSSIVESVLLEARSKQGKKFRVIIVDSGPMFEGRNLLKSLQNAGISTTYVLLASAGAVVQSSTISIVMLGAHSVLADGAMYSRAGTAAVAMMAKSAGLPVVCCCETYKFSDRVMLDSIVSNERGPTTALLPSLEPASALHVSSPVKPLVQQPTPLNLLYDVSRPHDLIAVICEAGTLPPRSVGMVLREYKPLASES